MQSADCAAQSENPQNAQAICRLRKDVFCANQSVVVTISCVEVWKVYTRTGREVQLLRWSRFYEGDYQCNLDQLAVIFGSQNSSTCLLARLAAYIALVMTSKTNPIIPLRLLHLGRKILRLRKVMNCAICRLRTAGALIPQIAQTICRLSTQSAIRRLRSTICRLRKSTDCAEHVHG